MDQTSQGPQSQSAPGQRDTKGASGKNTGMAAIAYIVFFIPLLTDAKNDPFVKYHVKQGLTLFISAVAVWLVVSVIPMLGLLVAPVLNIILLVLLVLGIVNAVKGVEKPLPIIGRFADNFKF